MIGHRLENPNGRFLKVSVSGPEEGGKRYASEGRGKDGKALPWA